MDQISSDLTLPSPHGPPQLCKVDTQTKTQKKWHLAGFQVSEPIFIPRPGGEAEDDGVVVASLLNEQEEREVGTTVALSHQRSCLVR